MESLATPLKQSWLSWFARGLLILSALVLTARLIELQIIKGGYYRALAEGNRIRRVPISASRGKILARGGEILVGNRQVKHHVVFSPESGYEKKEIDQNTPQDEILTEWIRDYPLSQDIAHISGYLGQVNKDEVWKIDPNCSEKGPRLMSTLVGRGGLEEFYECQLRGSDGEELVEVDTTGKKVRLIGRKNPIAGQDLKTTIDYSLQKKAAELMQKKLEYPNGTVLEANRKGAVVVSDAKGEILTLYSSPSFNPNVFLLREKGSVKKVQEVLEDKNLPLFNRTAAGAYHPGSVFKLVTSIAALEEGKIDENFTYEDKGFIQIDEYIYRNWYYTQYGSTEGVIDLSRAITRSTDTFFYKLGEFVGVEKLAEWAGKFGLGKLTGIDIPGEIEGLIPTPKWKRLAKKEAWFLGNTYHMAIGQGDISLTPLQVNVMTSVVASKGMLCKPHIIDQQNECINLDLDKKNIDLVIKGMQGACSQGGTAFPFFGFNMPTACKTGTAETNEEDKTHAWFTAFAPADDPEIVVTVFVEKGGEGSYVAAPIAKEIMDFYFNERN